MRLSVDRIHDHEELVVKPAAPAVMATGLYAGTTLADDGSPILLFDPAGLAQVGGVKLEMQERTARIAQGPAEAVSRATAVLLFRGLDGGRRALRLAVVDRIEEVPVSAVKQAAGQLRVQVGEAILPLAGAAMDELGDGKVRVFRLNDGQHEMGYAFAEVLDFAAIENDVIHAERPGEISGVSLINGEPAELVDAALAVRQPCRRRGARYRAAGLPAARATIRGCRTCFARSSRPPAIASSATSDDGDADLVIAAQGDKVEATPTPFTCATEPEPKNKKDESIYRYDRAGLADGPEVGRGEGANERASAGRDHRRRARRAAVRRGRIGGRAGYVDPGAARRAPCRRVVGAAQPGADRDRLHALARARRDRLLGRHPRSRGRRARRPPLRADRRYGRRRGRKPVGAGAGARGDGRRAGSGSSVGMVETETGPLLLVDVAALIAGAEAKAAA